MTSAHQLPTNLNLFIATPSAIYTHDLLTSLRILFSCATHGIVSARAATNNSSLLAIADSQLVILHDPTRRSDRKYALKSYEGEPRLLLFSPDSRTLYFTTTLSTSIQAYCIPTGELLPPPQIHPSPPSILAISFDGNILLSASSAPPKIYLQDLRFGGSASVSFQPADVRSPAVFATFQAHVDTNPSYTSFLLGFQDGTLSLYRLVLPARRRTYQNVYLNQTQAFLLQPTRIGCVKRLHKAAMGGVTAAEFIPGYRSRAVSVGHDGRCRLVDFEGGGRVLRTWHVDGPATCLAVVAGEVVASRGRRDRDVLLGGDAARDDARGVYEGKETFIAIGCQTGKVLVFNVIGLLIHEVTMETPIVALEWVGDMSAPSVLPNRKRSLSTCIEEDEDERPVLNSLFPDSESLSGGEPEELSSTVKRRALSPSRPGARSPVRFDGGRDLFSSEVDSSCLGGRRSEIFPGAALHPDHAPEAPRRKSFLRPRIATETFKSPSPSPPPQGSMPIPRINPITSTVQKALHRTNSRKVFDVFFADALRASRSRSRSPSPSSVYSHSSNSEIWTTPPTKQDAPVEPPSRYHISPPHLRLKRAATKASTSSTGTRAQNYSRPLPSTAKPEPTPLPSRKVSFAEHTVPFPWEKPAQDTLPMEKHKTNFAERSPFPAPPGQQEKRDFSFEPGLHAQERKWELDLGDTERRGPAQVKRKRANTSRRGKGEGVGELRLEHQRLRAEMAMLREEFRALRQVIVEGRQRLAEE